AARPKAVLALRARSAPGLDATASALSDIPRLPRDTRTRAGGGHGSVPTGCPWQPGSPATSRLGFPGQGTAFIPSADPGLTANPPGPLPNAAAGSRGRSLRVRLAPPARAG